MASSNNFAFKRNSDPFLIPVSPAATRFDVPDGFFTTGNGKGTTSFCVVNPNNFWVRFKGSGKITTTGPTGNFSPVGNTEGWLLPPGFFGVFSTQYPRYMSAMSVFFQGLTPGSGTIEVSYGGGA